MRQTSRSIRPCWTASATIWMRTKGPLGACLAETPSPPFVARSGVAGHPPDPPAPQWNWSLAGTHELVAAAGAFIGPGDT